MSSNEKGFWKKFWEEVEPIISHSLCVFVLTLSLLFVALILLCLEYIFPEKKDFIVSAKTVDIWLVLVLLCLFGTYTIILITIRLYNNIRDELKNKKE